MEKGFLALLLLTLALCGNGCSEWNELDRKHKGAVIGTGAGAVLGGATTESIGGAALGGLAGGAAGYIIGDETDDDHDSHHHHRRARHR